MTKQEAWFLAYQSALRAHTPMSSHPDTGRPGHERAADLAEQDADEALKRLEQREREGRFGSVDLSNPEGVAAEFRDLTTNRDEWMERARRADAEVERLKGEKSLMAKAASDADTEAERLRAELALSEEGASTLNGLHDVATERARKAESLLKEALRSAGRLMDALGHLVRYGRPAPGGEQIGNVDHIEQAMGAVSRALARARQEGFSDGE